MKGDIEYRAVRYKEFFTGLLLMVVFLAVTVVVFIVYRIWSPYFVTGLISLELIIFVIIQAGREVTVRISFGSEALKITEWRRDPDKPHLSVELPYHEVERYSIFSMFLLKKRIGNIVRIRAGHRYSYYLTWTSGKTHGFGEKEWEELQKKLDAKLRHRKKKGVSDYLLQGGICVLPILLLLVSLGAFAVLLWNIER